MYYRYHTIHPAAPREDEDMLQGHATFCCSLIFSLSSMGTAGSSLMKVCCIMLTVNWEYAPSFGALVLGSGRLYATGHSTAAFSVWVQSVVMLVLCIHGQFCHSSEVCRIMD